LYWKKKKKIDIEFPAEEQDLRNAYRIRPDSGRPIILNVAGDSYMLINVSGTGCSFRSYNYPEGYQAPGTLKIPSDDIIFPVTIRIVSKQKDLCHCEFIKIAQKSEDAIHAYVLDAQKAILRNR
jgi:hypothetical protein